MIYLLLVVIVIILVFYLLPNKAAFILSGACVVVVLLAAFVFWKDLQEQEQIAKVQIDLALNRQACPASAPLQFTITNHSTETVYRVYFRYTVYRVGYSTPVSKSYGNEVTANKILETNEQEQGCISLKDVEPGIPDNELVFKSEYKRVWFDEPIH